MTLYQKGANFERSIVRDFWENGFTAIRAAGSGSAPQPIPDVIAMKGSRILVIECKTTSRPTFRLGRGDIAKLRAFTERADCEAYLALKFNNVKPKFFPLDLVAGRTVTKNDAALSFESLLGVQKTL